MSRKSPGFPHLPSSSSTQTASTASVHSLETSATVLAETYQTLFDTMAQGVVYQDASGQIVSANKSAEKILGLSLAQLLGQTSIDREWACFKEDGSPYPGEEHPSMLALKSGKKVNNVKMGVKHPQKNHFRWININAVPIFEKGAKKPKLVYTTFEDITNLTNSQQLLDVRLRLQQAVSSLSQKALAKYDLPELFNDAVLQLTTILQVEYAKVLQLQPASSELLLKAGVGWHTDVVINKTTVPAGNSSQSGYTLTSKRPVIVHDLPHEHRFSGSSLLNNHHVVSGMTVILYNNSGPYGVLGVHTAKKREFTGDDLSYMQSVANILSFAIQQDEIESQLRLNEESFRNLIETIPQIVWTNDPDGCHDYFNQRWYEYTGTTPQTALGDGWNKTLHPDDRNRSWRVWNTALTTGQQYEIQYRIKNGQTGKYRWFLGRAVPIRNDEGAIVKWFGTCTDIHDQKMFQEDLEQSKALNEAILQSLPSQVAVLDNKGRIVAVNDTHKQFLMEHTKLFASDIATGDKYLAILEKAKDQFGDSYPEIKNGITKVLNSTLEGFSLEYAFQTDQEKSWFLLQVAPMKFEAVGVVVSHTDITERKRLEQQKDEFMSIASHELKTPLTSIKAYGQVLQTLFKRKGDEGSTVLISKMDSQLNKLTELISDFLDVSKIEAGKLHIPEEWFELDPLIEEMVDVLQLTTEDHELKIISSAQVSVYANRDRLGQVLTNFLSNAIKYSPESNAILIGSKQTVGGVRVFVKDFGIGISKEKQTKIFDRFYRVSESNKQTMPGLGLGLYIAATIIHRFSGKIWVESQKGSGATFFFELPKERSKYHKNNAKKTGHNLRR